ncbi:uncharacterized protein LOC130750898 [Actinidia eriantha]|uniref:uncharacterized protein LOC130750898 n=1 Tax=Actinidia eriantha TaxID=165200 RepID=UPI00258DB2F2|nr:uncharacterized protein LOC130750898 [Actinidia eriantha]
MEEKHQEEQEQETSPTTSSTSKSTSPVFIVRFMSKRRTWVFLFVFVYAILMLSSWNILKSTLSWYKATSSPASRWPEMYAAVVLGAVFGLLAVAASLAVAVKATVVTWITVLVLLTFSGKPRREVVVEGKKLTAEISGFAVKILIKEGNVVAAVCAVLCYFALIRRNREEFGSC